MTEPAASMERRSDFSTPPRPGAGAPVEMTGEGAPRPGGGAPVEMTEKGWGVRAARPLDPAPSIRPLAGPARDEGVRDPGASTHRTPSP